MHGVLRCNIFSAWFLDIRTYQLVSHITKCANKDGFNRDSHICPCEILFNSNCVYENYILTQSFYYKTFSFE